MSDISNEKIFLKTPSISELHYRQEWMKDPKTMSYNAGYDMDLKGYDKETETIGTHQGCLRLLTNHPKDFGIQNTFCSEHAKRV